MSSPLAVIGIKGLDGSLIHLHISKDDDPFILAKNFVDTHGLAKSLIKRLAHQIKHNLEEAELLIPRLTSEYDQINDQHCIKDKDSFAIENQEHFLQIEERDDRLMQQQHEERESPEILKSSHTTNHSLESTYEAARNTWSTSSKDVLTHQKSFLSTIKKSKSESNLNLTISTGSRLSHSPASLSRPATPSSSNQRMYDRMYSEAAFSRQRLENLKTQVEDERLALIRTSSFREPAGFLSPVQRAAASPSSISRNRALSVGALGKTPDGSAINSNDRLYYNHQQWLKERNTSVEKLSRQLRDEQEQAVNRELTLQPHLSSSRSMQLPRMQSSQEVFEALHQSSEYYHRRKEDLRKQQEQKLSQQHTFVPQITPNSKRIVRRKQLASQSPSGTMRTSNSTASLGFDSPTAVFDQQNPVGEEGEGMQSGKPSDSLTEDYFRLLVADPNIIDSAAVQSPVKTHRKTPPTISTAPIDSSEWNPFDSASRHYQQTSPPALLSANTQSPSTTFRSYRALRDAAAEGKLSPASTKRSDGLFSPTSPAYSFLSVRDVRRDGNLNAAPQPRPSSGHAQSHRQDLSGSRGRSMDRAGGKLSRSSSASSTVLEPHNKSLFDRLYDARFESALEQKRAADRHAPRHSHKPDIGSASKRSVEKDRDAFFGRLYDQLKEKETARTNHFLQEEARRHAEIQSNSVLKINGEQRRVLSRSQEAQHINRLWESGKKAEQRVQDSKKLHAETVAQKQHSRFMRAKSSSIALKAHLTALEEIFNVLLVTALLSADGQQRQTNAADSAAMSSGEHKSAEQDAVSALLDTTLALPDMLQPKLLADSIATVLQALKPHAITRDQFIAAVQKRMSDGTLPPIGYLLTRPERDAKPVNRQRSAMLQSSEELQLQQCRDRPHLVATATESLSRKRHRLRRLGQQSVEDSLLSYRDFQEAKLMERRVALEKEVRSACSFAPQLHSSLNTSRRRSVSRERTSSGGDGSSRAEHSAVIPRKRSNSAPPRSNRSITSTGDQHLSSGINFLTAADAAVKAVAELTQRMTLQHGAASRSSIESHSIEDGAGASDVTASNEAPIGRLRGTSQRTSASVKSAGVGESEALHRAMRRQLYQPPSSSRGGADGAVPHSVASYAVSHAYRQQQQQQQRQLTLRVDRVTSNPSPQHQQAGLRRSGDFSALYLKK